MRINARLDDDHSRKLEHIVHITGSNISDVIKQAIESYYEKLMAQQGNAEKILQQNGFIGCAEADSDLSSNYKESYTKGLGLKHDHS